MRCREFVAVLIICWATGCNKENPVSDVNNSASDVKNSAPVIQSIVLTPDTITLQQSCLIKCNATDQDNDNLTYEWESVGNIAGSGSTIWYSPAGCCGLPQVVVTVKDGKGGRVDSTITILLKYQ